MTTKEELRDAVNLICKYVKENLPPKWQLAIVMDSDEAYVELIDPDFQSFEYEVEAISSACWVARETESGGPL